MNSVMDNARNLQFLVPLICIPRTHVQKGNANAARITANTKARREWPRHVAGSSHDVHLFDLFPGKFLCGIHWITNRAFALPSASGADHLLIQSEQTLSSVDASVGKNDGIGLDATLSVVRIWDGACKFIQLSAADWTNRGPRRRGRDIARGRGVYGVTAGCFERRKPRRERNMKGWECRKREKRVVSAEKEVR